MRSIRAPILGRIWTDVDRTRVRRREFGAAQDGWRSETNIYYTLSVDGENSGVYGAKDRSPATADVKV
ncbi:MAG: hypothetical protein R3C03_14215 [Pirellulaceae bacterium]